MPYFLTIVFLSGSSFCCLFPYSPKAKELCSKKYGVPMLGIYGIALLLSKTCAGSAGFAAHRVVSFDESGFEFDAAEFRTTKSACA